VVHGQRWICRLAEVSDERPAADRLSWYLVFEGGGTSVSPQPAQIRKLEIVTPATRVLKTGWGGDLSDRLVEWLLSNEQDGRVVWFGEA
jgi:hypothetical protein